MDKDEYWMNQALQLAARGRGGVHPNPMVGAILVRGTRVVGQGFHRQIGQNHAEVEALRCAGARAKGSTLYVNLEPCCHWGRTPPCCDAIVRAGVKRVVAAMRDPNPLVSGKGFGRLRRVGIPVSVGTLESEARHLNRAFLVWVTKGRPYVTLKAASSLDGRMATIKGESQWITGPESRRAGHALRSTVDAIAVGAETVRRDNPSLTSHGAGRNPIRIVFESQLRLSPRYRLFDQSAPTWRVTSSRMAKSQVERWRRHGIKVIQCRARMDGRVSVQDALHRLAKSGIAHLLLEGGPTLQDSFLNERVVDEIVWFVAPKIFGQVGRLREAHVLENVQCQTFGRDYCFTATMKR